jgi:hypothetical protein
MSEHTKEPWKVTKNRNYTGIYAEAGGPMVLASMNDIHIACKPNAERIVACVNACAGISTEELEEVIFKQRVDAVFAREMAIGNLADQRDELLDALEGIMMRKEDILNRMHYGRPDTEALTKEAFAKLESAISKVRAAI